MESAYVGAVSAGAVGVATDTTVADYREDGLVLLWESDSKYEVKTSLSLTSGNITFNSPTTVAFSAVYVCPLRVGKQVEGITLRRGPNKQVKCDVEFRVELNKDLGASAGFPTLGGIDVFSDVIHDLGGYDDTVLWDMDYFDNETGLVGAEIKRVKPDQISILSVSTTTKSGLIRLRKWLHLCKGKLKPFWLPSQGADLTLVSNVLSSSTSIQVTSIGYQGNYTTSAVGIYRKNGVNTYHEVLSGTTSGGVDTLVLSAAAGTGANVSDVLRVSFLRKVRLDSDRVEIRHEENNFATVKVPVREVAA
jgi:hypothetical protein